MVTPYADGRKKGATRPSFLIATKACPGLRSGMRLKGFRVRRRTPTFVIPAKAGIHALIFRERTSTAIPPPTSTRRPHFVFPARARPEPRSGAGIQRGGWGGTNDPRTLPTTSAPIFIPSCAGRGRHERLVRKHVPDSDQGCAQAAFERAVEPQHSALSSFRGPSIRHSRRPLRHFVIPAKAGIHALTSRERTPTAIPTPTSTRRPHLVFPVRARPVPRYAAGIQGNGACFLSLDGRGLR